MVIRIALLIKRDPEDAIETHASPCRICKSVKSSGARTFFMPAVPSLNFCTP